MGLIPVTAKMLRTSYVLGALVAVTVASATVANAEDAGLSTDWAKEHSTRVRLVAGSVATAKGKPRVMAGVEIELDPGWKTYWRNPGTSGVPPRFDWAGSENLEEAIPLFPAPSRFTEKDGDTIGYKTRVVLPIEIKAKDPAKPVKLRLGLEYGVCKDVCVPVQPMLELTLPPDVIAKPGNVLAAAVEQVPRVPEKRRDGDPHLKRVTIDTQGAKPNILIEAAFPGSPEGADIFLEAPDGIWIPLPKAMGEPRDGIHRFLVDLTDGADVADLKGRVIRTTIVSVGGRTDTSFKFE